MNNITIVFIVLGCIILLCLIGIGIAYSVSVSNATVPEKEPEEYRDIKTKGSITIIYDKVMYKSHHTSDSTTVTTSSSVTTTSDSYDNGGSGTSSDITSDVSSNVSISSRGNIRRTLVNEGWSVGYNTKAPLSNIFYACFPKSLNVSFNDDMINSIADALKIDKKCINTPSMNINSLLNIAKCATEGASLNVQKERKVVSVVYPFTNKVTDIQIKKIIFDLNKLLNSKDYVVVNVSIYSDEVHSSQPGIIYTQGGGVLTLLFYIIDSSKINPDDMVKIKYKDAMGLSYNLVYGGYTSAVDKYTNLCDEI